MSPVSTAQQIAVFDQHTRHGQREIAAIPYSAGAKSSRELPKSNYLARIKCLVKGSFTAAHASTTTLTKSPYGPWNLIDRIRVKLLNSNVITLTGYELFLASLVSTFNCRADQTGDNQVFQFGNVVSVGGTSNNIRFYFSLPITLNDRDLRGLMLLQSEQVQAVIEIDWATIGSDAGPFSDAASGSIAISNESINCVLVPEIFSVPPAQEHRYPMQYMYQTVHDRIDIVAVGEQVYKPLRGNIITRMILQHHLNGGLAPSADIDLIEVEYNQTERTVSHDIDVLRGDNRDMYGRDLPDGVYALDFNHQGVPGLGTSRDYLNTANITDLSLRTRVVSGATLGTGAHLNIIKQQLVPIKGLGGETS